MGYLHFTFVTENSYKFVTCVALAKAGLVVGPVLRPSGRPSGRLSVRPQHFRGTKFLKSATPKVFIPFHSNFA